MFHVCSGDLTMTLRYLRCVCVSMLVLIRERILANDFAHNVRLLQNYPEVCVISFVAFSSTHSDNTAQHPQHH